jgi:hypothetical protein
MSQFIVTIQNYWRKKYDVKSRHFVQSHSQLTSNKTCSSPIICTQILNLYCASQYFWEREVSYVSISQSSLQLLQSRSASTLHTHENPRESETGFLRNVPALLGDEIKSYMDLFSHLTSYSVEIRYNYWHILQKHNSQLLCDKAKEITIKKLLQILHS